MVELYLIGTFHFDLYGSQRLFRLLRHIKPNNVAVEYSSSGVNYARDMEFILNQKNGLELIIAGFKKLIPGAHDETIQALISNGSY